MRKIADEEKFKIINKISISESSKSLLKSVIIRDVSEPSLLVNISKSARNFHKPTHNYVRLEIILI